MNLAHVLDGHDPGSIALIAAGRETSYGELTGAVDRLRGGLASHGIDIGDRVVLLCGNSTHFVTAYFAVIGLGAVAGPLNPLSPAPELQTEVARAGAKAVVVEEPSAAAWSGVDRHAVPTVEIVLAVDGAPAGDDALPFDDVMHDEPVPIAEVGADFPAVLIFTSGTAGAPRAAALSHGNLRASIRQTQTAGDVTADDVIFGVLPLFHIFGLNIVMTLGLAVGATVMLVERFNPRSSADSIRTGGVTVVPGVPAMWTAFADLEGLPAESFAHVRIALSGAAPLPVTVFRRFHERFGVEIAEGYGLTETAATVTTSLGHPIRPGSVGRALDGVDVRLVNADGDALVGDIGEVWVRGPNVFHGYYGDPAASAAVLHDGWLLTGDMATADDDGFVYLVDRAKDLVIVSGFNVFPAEVEHVLAAHPAVAEAGVVGVEHHRTGEAVKAYVVRQPGADVDEGTLIEHCLDHLARYKCPTTVVFVEELPRSDTGKLVRRRLDDEPDPT